MWTVREDGRKKEERRSNFLYTCMYGTVAAAVYCRVKEMVSRRMRRRGISLLDIGHVFLLLIILAMFLCVGKFYIVVVGKELEYYAD